MANERFEVKTKKIHSYTEVDDGNRTVRSTSVFTKLLVDNKTGEIIIDMDELCEILNMQESKLELQQKMIGKLKDDLLHIIQMDENERKEMMAYFMFLKEK